MALTSGSGAYPRTGQVPRHSRSLPVRSAGRGAHATDARGGVTPRAGLAEQRWGANYAWPLVADDLFRVAHDVRGWPVVDRQVVTLGLSAAVLAELLLTGYATVHAGVLMPCKDSDPLDVIAAAVMRQLRAELDGLPLQDWLTLLAVAELAGHDVYDQVGHRLENNRHVTRTTGSLLDRSMRRPARYVPTDTDSWPWGRLTVRLCRADRLDLADVTLAGLVLATGLHHRVLLGEPDSIEARLRRHVAEAPDMIQQLISHTTVAATT